MNVKNSHYYLNELSLVEKLNFAQAYTLEHNKTIDEFLNNTSYSFFTFIINAFHWSNSPQGYNYWYKIATKHNNKNIKYSNEAIVAIYCSDNAVNKLKFTI